MLQQAFKFQVEDGHHDGARARPAPLPLPSLAHISVTAQSIIIEVEILITESPSPTYPILSLIRATVIYIVTLLP